MDDFIIHSEDEDVMEVFGTEISQFFARKAMDMEVFANLRGKLLGFEGWGANY